MKRRVRPVPAPLPPGSADGRSQAVIDLTSDPETSDSGRCVAVVSQVLPHSTSGPLDEGAGEGVYFPCSLCSELVLTSEAGTHELQHQVSPLSLLVRRGAAHELKWGRLRHDRNHYQCFRRTASAFQRLAHICYDFCAKCARASLVTLSCSWHSSVRTLQLKRAPRGSLRTARPRRQSAGPADAIGAGSLATGRPSVPWQLRRPGTTGRGRTRRWPGHGSWTPVTSASSSPCRSVFVAGASRVVAAAWLRCVGPKAWPRAQQRPCWVDPSLPSDGVVPALKQCLESQPGIWGRAYLCASAQHICSARTDMGWGCGWRNLQMTTWHLLRRGGEYRQALFAGLGAPPDVASLQLWLEWAWRQGYDLEGCRQLDGRVQAVATEAGHAGEVG